MELGKSFINAVNKYKIKKEDILFAAKADFDEEYRFATTILAVTKEQFIVARYPYDDNGEYHFGGYSGWQIQAEEEEQEPILTFYDLKEIDRLEALREIGSGIFVIHMEKTPYRICRFSNTKMGSMMQLCRIFDKVKKDEALSEEDTDLTRGAICCPTCGMIYPDRERKVCPKCINKKSILVRLIGYFKPYKVALFVMVLCYLATAVLNLAWPYLSGTVLYDYVLKKDPAFLERLHLPEGQFVAALGIITLAMILTKILIQGFGILQSVLTARIAPEVVAKLKGQVFSSIGRLSISFFTKRQTGGLMTRVTNDAEEISGFFIDGIPYFLINIASMSVMIVIMFVLNPILAIVSIALLPVLFFISYRMMPHLWHYFGKRHRANRRLNGQINENFTGARVVKAFGREKQEMTRFESNNRRLKDAEVDVVRYDTRFGVLYTSVEDMIEFLVWAVGGALILSHMNMELGLLITFSGYVGQLKGPLEFMSRLVRWYTNAMNAAQRMFEIMDAVPEIKENENPYRPEKLKGEIELQHVTFGYEPNKPVLKDVSFHVKPGQVLGIVGRSGAGKSTLVNLISRLYDTQEGQILVDGVNVKEYGFDVLRRNVAMVSQETYIFMGTVAENIAYARPDATRKEIIEAAIFANAHDFICKMPEGYDTIIGSSRRSLSGGEKQRLSIARAILADPKILILDEATSAVDTETELAIQTSLERLEKGRTVLSIAHRLSTLRNADYLIVIDGGRITEAGTHEELLEKKGTFYKLSELQTKALAMRGLEE